MRRRPKGARYRNLTVRGEVIYYEREKDGNRDRFSCHTRDWDQAAAVRALYERQVAERRGRAADGQLPIFSEFAERYLREGMGHLAGSTREDRESLLGEGGIITQALGPMRLDEIDSARLFEFWMHVVEGRNRSRSTGRNYLSAASGVLGYAVDLGLLRRNPVDDVRPTLRRRRRTKSGRAEEERSGAKVNPISDAWKLRAFVAESAKAYELRFGNGVPVRQQRDGHVATILMLDAGLRAGEVAGLRWQDVTWGDGPADRGRALLIRENRARGKHDGSPKSGRSRVVALSRRLRSLLRAYWMAKGQPGGEERVIPRFHQGNFQKRHFDVICAKVGLAGHTPKDLRDTYASQLLTAGIQIAYIGGQLGHSDVATTARHYARWCGEDGYREPMRVEEGEVPADVLARIVADARPGEKVATIGA